MIIILENVWAIKIGLFIKERSVTRERMRDGDWMGGVGENELF